MKSRTLIGYGLLCSVLLTAFAIAAASSFAAVNANGNAEVAIIPPGQNYEGLNYGEWGAKWWQWVFSIPYAGGQHPLFDQSGEYADIGQSGNVWFLGGVMWANGQDPPVGPVTRTITVPSGTALFFPIANGENNNVEATGLTLPQLWETQNWLYDLKDNNLYATVDGKPVQGLADYLTISPVFGIYLTSDNVLYSAWGIGEYDPSYVYPDVAAGFFLMVKPLPVGKHTITFGVKNLSWSMDIIYDITVQ
jgi:hypothetical protein